jgi:hypothetical protein
MTVRVAMGKLDAYTGGTDQYGLYVASSDGTTIIDGTSDVFRILATGTFSGTGTNGTQTDIATVTLTGLGVFAATPAHLSFVAPANDTAANQQLGTYIRGNSADFGASTSGGPTTSAAVLPILVTYIKTHLDGSGYCEVYMTMLNHVGSNQTNYGRYYVLAQTSL